MAYEALRGRQFSPESCADALDVSISQVHRWITSGEIKASKLGTRCTRIDGDSIASFLMRRENTPRIPRGKHAKKPNATELAGQA